MQIFSSAQNFADRVLQKFVEPFIELFNHFLLTISALCFMAGTEIALRLLHFQEKVIPIFGITLESWLFFMEVFTVTFVLFHGLWRALRMKNEQ
ncbi:hypothetical protein CPY51_30485 [Rhizobium tubonense]|uniref:Uncharacterized protein n=1 Tax=Rhizobium tubonense TaxID=484088 RepID=A0A2W4E6S6_9HYPH|nr:hypothetical protein CPY51_30485 [Rhizobium tubonense]